MINALCVIKPLIDSDLKDITPFLEIVGYVDISLR